MASQETETTASKARNSIWIDQETALLLRIFLDYLKKLADAQDWETVCTKYEIITKKLLRPIQMKKIPKNFPGRPKTSIRAFIRPKIIALLCGSIIVV